MTVTDEDRARAQRWLDRPSDTPARRSERDRLAVRFARHRQAAYAAGLERAAVIADHAWRPDIGTAIRAEKDKT